MLRRIPIVVVLFLIFVVAAYFSFRRRLDAFGFLNLSEAPLRLLNGSCVVGVAHATSIPPYEKLIGLPQDRYFSHHCISGGVNDALYRSCIFRNICYDLKSNEWVAHLRHVQTVNGKYISEFPIVDQAEACPSYEFSHPFLTTHIAHPREKDPLQFEDAHITPVIRPGPIEDADWYPHPNVILSRPPNTNNIGHFLMEGILPMLVLETFFSENSDLSAVDSIIYKAPFGPADKGFQRAILDPLLSSASKDWDEVASHAAGTGFRHLCFQSLKAGSGRFELDSRDSIRAVEILLFRGAIYKAFHVVPPVPPLPCQITVFLKLRGRRRPIFDSDLEDQLVATFPHCKVVVVDPVSLEFGEQVRLLAHTTVFVAPCGGISMPAMFLPHDSVHVSICSYHVETHCSVSVEGYLWKWIPHVMTVHYPIDPMEDIDVAGQLSDFNRNGVSSEYDDDWRALGRCEAASNFYFFVLHSLQVHVRTPRLIGLIHFGMINSIG